jgi:glycosyltransferase involved in cell wall biosynthesis
MKLSIVVPVFNAEQYLKQCIDSILNQNFKDFELILVDDCSTDTSLKICSLYKQNNSNIKVIHLEKNSGVSYSRNKGIDVAEGEYITFVDSDDFVEENIYSDSVSKIEENNVDFVIYGFYEVHKLNKIKRKQRIPSGIIDINSIMDKIVDDGTLTGFLLPGVWSCIYKLSIIKNNNIKFDNEIYNNEDGLFNLKYCLCSEKLYSASNVPYYDYRFVKKQLTYERYKQNIFDVVNKKVLTVYSGEKYNFTEQIKKREITIALWNIINVVNIKDIDIMNKIKEIKKICYSKQVSDNINKIDARKLNRYKKFFFYLIKNKKYKTLYICIKYIMPVFQAIMVR